MYWKDLNAADDSLFYSVYSKEIQTELDLNSHFDFDSSGKGKNFDFKLHIRYTLVPFMPSCDKFTVDLKWL